MFIYIYASQIYSKKGFENQQEDSKSVIIITLMKQNKYINKKHILS